MRRQRSGLTRQIDEKSEQKTDKIFWPGRDAPGSFVVLRNRIREGTSPIRFGLPSERRIWKVNFRSL